MSLQIWLPLTGDLHNQGLAGNLEVINSNTTFDNDGKIGQCASFNGSSSRISINNINIGNIWSYGCWFYSTSTDRAWESIMLLSNNGSDADTQLGFYIHTTQTRMQSTANGQYNSNIPYSYVNKWTHFFATFDGSTLITYINGIEVNRKSITASLLERTHLVIGARSSSTSGGQAGATAYFLGKVNDVRLYDHCCSVKEVKEIAKGLMLHYKLDNVIENNVYDCSGYSNNGIVTGSLTNENDTAQYSYSTYISNGTSSRITTPVLYFNKENITLNIWFKSSNTSPAGNYHMIIDSVANRQWYEVAINNTGYFRGGLFVNGTRYADNCSTKTGLNGAWHMLTLTYDGSIIKRYFDGVMEKSTTVSMTSGLSSPTALVIGRNGPSSTYACKEASLSDFRIYATALSQEDILDLYHTPASIDNQGNIYARELVEI